MSTQPSPSALSTVLSSNRGDDPRGEEEMVTEPEEGGQYLMEVNDGLAFDGEYPESASGSANSYDDLLNYCHNQECACNHPELSWDENQLTSASTRAQLFRPVVALQPFLEAAPSQTHLAQLASWHYEQYQMYSSYMDVEAGRGGCGNHLDQISKKVEAIEPTQHLWQSAFNRDEVSKYPTDRQIEESFMSNGEQLQLYEQSMRMAYKAVEDQQVVSLPSKVKKRHAGSSTFRQPGVVGVDGQSVNRTDVTSKKASEQVMNDLDSLLGGVGSRSHPTASKVKQQPHLDFDSEIPIGEQLPAVVAKSKGFLTAKDQLLSDLTKKGPDLEPNRVSPDVSGVISRGLGTGRKYPASAFTAPVGQSNLDAESTPGHCVGGLSDRPLKHIDPKMIDTVLSTIVAANTNSKTKFDDISGLEDVKDALFELVVMPILNPEIFTGIKSPSKGLLLFGPPGTGKTLIAKCVAAESHATFFSISASTITSKWIGDGEKMVKALFEVARTRLPAVIFIDEVDSLLSQRSSEEHESSRRMKTEFLTQFDGLSTDAEERLLVIGATNRPHDIDEAARRRFVKRLYIPLPDQAARIAMIRKNLKEERHELTDADLAKISLDTKWFSGADMANLCKEAVLNPTHEALRSANKCPEKIKALTTKHIRSVSMKDFEKARLKVNSSVGESELKVHEDWNKQFGTGAG